MKALDTVFKTFLVITEDLNTRFEIKKSVAIYYRRLVIVSLSPDDLMYLLKFIFESPINLICHYSKYVSFNIFPLITSDSC